MSDVFVFFFGFTRASLSLHWRYVWHWDMAFLGGTQKPMVLLLFFLACLDHAEPQRQEQQQQQQLRLDILTSFV